MANSSKKVLIFGATGEIGSRIARGCVEAGHKTTGVTRGTNTRHRVNTDGVKFIHGDKGDEKFLESLAKNDFDVVIDTMAKWNEHQQLAEKFFNGRIEHYFTCSATGVYPPLQYFPGDENHSWQQNTGVNIYAQSEQDMYSLSLWREKKFPVTIFRPTCIVGPGRVPFELWGGRNILYYKLMKEGKPVGIPVSGDVLIQAGYNDDLADAFVKAIDKGDEITGETFIISSKKAITLERYFNVAKEVLGSSSPVEYISIEETIRRRPGDDINDWSIRFMLEHMCFDISKAEQVLGYSPKYSTEQGLAKALEWCIDEDLL